MCKEVGLLQEQKRLVQLDTIGEVGENSGHRQQQQQQKKVEVEFVRLLQALSSPQKNQ